MGVTFIFSALYTGPRLKIQVPDLGPLGIRDHFQLYSRYIELMCSCLLGYQVAYNVLRIYQIEKNVYAFKLEFVLDISDRHLIKCSTSQTFNTRFGKSRQRACCAHLKNTPIFYYILRYRPSQTWLVDTNMFVFHLESKK